MKESYRKTFVLALGIVALVLTSGCQEERVVDPKSCPAKYRLLASENRNLEKEITRLKNQHRDEIKDQERTLAKCLREKQTLAKESTKRVEDAMDFFLKACTEENARLREISESLRAHVQALQKAHDMFRGEIARLKEEIQELRKQPRLPDKPQPL